MCVCVCLCVCVSVSPAVFNHPVGVFGVCLLLFNAQIFNYMIILPEGVAALIVPRLLKQRWTHSLFFLY